MTKLRLVFMGTPDFAVPTLRALCDAGHEIVMVYTQPPRPAGRGQKPRPSPVQAFAESRGLPVRTPVSLKSDEDRAAFAALRVDAAVVVAYGLILPEPVLAAPRFGCLNLHASLLPRWRGAAPLQRAIMSGDRETGVAVMQMEAGLDTGPVLASRRVPIDETTTTPGLHDRLAEIGAPLMVETLEALAAGTAVATPQPEDGVTYAAKIDKAEARIDWSQPAIDIDRLIRALNPFPGAWFETDGQRIKVHAAAVAEGHGQPGEVLDDRLTVACGKGALRLIRLQRQGKGAVDADAFLRGFAVERGTVFR